MRGGAEVHINYLSKYLAELGCEVHIFTKGLKDSLRKIKTKKGKLIIHQINVHTTDVKDPLVSGRLNWYLFEARALNEVMHETSKRKFDIIHTQGWPATAFMLKHFNNLNINWIHTFHSLDKNSRKKMTAEDKKVIKIHEWVDATVVDADRLIVVSNKFREEIIKEFKGVARKTVVIGNGIDPETFIQEKSSPQTVLYIGRFSKEKGVSLIPEIAETILKKNKRYKFIAVALLGGKAESIPELKEIIDKFKILEKEYTNRFIWKKDPLFMDQIAELHRKSGVYIQPSLYETFGICVLEAMATGRPVVVTNVGGMPELVGKAGLVAKPDAKDVSQKVIKLLKNKSLRLKLSKSGIEKSKQFDWKIIAQKTLDLYKEVIEENKQKMNQNGR